MSLKPNIVLFYPRLGWMDAFVLDLPLSVIYVAYDCQKNGIDVRIIDQRLQGDNWREMLDRAIDDNTVLVGFSVMTGNPINNVLEATRFVKEKRPHMPTVWGGVHVTICPNEVIKSKLIDYIICGHGSEALYELVKLLLGNDINRENIPGLGWLEENNIRLNPVSQHISFPPLDELNLDSLEMSKYTRFEYQDNVYTLFTSFGCPHKCKFCFAPIFYGAIKGKKWFPYPAEEVIDHITKIVAKHNIGYISLLDEIFFLDLKRSRKILEGVYDSGVRVTWGIRGVRIDDLDRMDKDFLKLLVKVGVKQMMIGAESGSPRMLEFMKKGITPEQTIRVNKKLKDFPELNPSFNFFSGLPNETIDDLYQSVDLILRILEDNPKATISSMTQYMPYPGSEFYEMCKEMGHKEPKTLEGWANVDSHYPKDSALWLDRKFENILHVIQTAVLFADNKVQREFVEGQDSIGTADKPTKKKSRGIMIKLLYNLIIIGSKIYKPIALFRLRKKFFKFPIDYFAIKAGSALLNKITKADKLRLIVKVHDK